MKAIPSMFMEMVSRISLKPFMRVAISQNRISLKLTPYSTPGASYLRNSKWKESTSMRSMLMRNGLGLRGLSRSTNLFMTSLRLSVPVLSLLRYNAPPSMAARRNATSPPIILRTLTSASIRLTPSRVSCSTGSRTVKPSITAREGNRMATFSIVTGVSTTRVAISDNLCTMAFCTNPICSTNDRTRGTIMTKSTTAATTSAVIRRNFFIRIEFVIFTDRRFYPKDRSDFNDLHAVRESLRMEAISPTCKNNTISHKWI